MLEALGPPPLSAVTLRFRRLVLALMSPASPARLDNQSENEVQLRIERPGKAPAYFVLLDAAKDDERSLKLRLGRLTSEAVNDQHVVILSNQSAWPAMLKEAKATYGARLSLYQLDAEGTCLLGHPPPLLKQALRDDAPAPDPSETAEAFSARLAEADAEKQRRLDSFDERLTGQTPVATFALGAIAAVLYGLFRLWTPADGVLCAQLSLGALVPRLIKDGEVFRLLSGGLLHDQLLLVGLNLAVLLSLGYQTERLLGTGRFLLLFVLCLLGAGLFPVLFAAQDVLPRKTGLSPALFGLCGALWGLSVFPKGLPPDTVQRVRKTAVAGLVPGAILMVLHGDRAVLGLGLLLGFGLTASGALPSLRLSDPDPPSRMSALLQRAFGAVSALLLCLSLAAALVVGKPWSPDPAVCNGFKTRLAPRAIAGDRPALPFLDKDTPKPADGEAADLADRSVSLPGVGVSLKLPARLQPPTRPEGSQDTFRFGDLEKTYAQLDVVVRRHAAPFKKAAAIAVAFDQAVALVRADRQHEVTAGRLTVAGEPKRFQVNGMPAIELSFSGAEGQKARTAVLVNRAFLVVLSYAHSELLPPKLDLDLAHILGTLEDEFAGSALDPSKTKKKKRRR